MFDYIQSAVKLVIDKAIREHILGYRPVVMCVLKDIHSEKFILIKPAQKPDLWILPQEGLEFGESVESAATRCIQEELGMDANQINFRRSRWINRVKFPESRKNERDLKFSVRGMIGKSYFVAHISCSSDSTIIANRSEVEESKWVTQQDALQLVKTNTEAKKNILANAINNY